jgi:hypothetical protein
VRKANIHRLFWEKKKRQKKNIGVSQHNKQQSFNTVSFVPAIASTSGSLHGEFVRRLFLQAHREIDRFFAASGVYPRGARAGRRAAEQHARRAL